MTHFVGMVSVPGRAGFAFRQIEFVALDPQRVLAILVFADGEVQNRVVQVRRAFSPSELEEAANYLNAHFAGQSLALIRAALLRELRDARSEMERLLAASLDLAEPGREELPFEGMVVAGQTRLLGLQDLNDIDRLRGLFEAFAEKRELLQLLERTARAPGMRVFIGEETGLAPLEGMSLVTAPYGRGGQALGVLGVIGPSRMAYERVIPVVEATAAALGAALDGPG
jgi:heat-inducible transcriptional repressor